MILRHFNLSLRCPSHEVAGKLKEFMDTVRMYRDTYKDWDKEEIFIESTAYLTLLGAIRNNNIEGTSLAKGIETNVGELFSIPARSSVFTPVRNRDEENVPTNSIQYRMLK